MNILFHDIRYFGLFRALKFAYQRVLRGYDEETFPVYAPRNRNKAIQSVSFCNICPFHGKECVASMEFFRGYDEGGELNSNELYIAFCPKYKECGNVFIVDPLPEMSYHTDIFGAAQ